MKTPETFMPEVNEAFAQTGFDKKPLGDLNFPPIVSVPNGTLHPVKYAVHGDLASARVVVFQGHPHLTPFEKPHYQTRLAGQQIALGDEYAVVGIESNPNARGAYSHGQRKQIAKGDFSPIAERHLRVVEHADLRDDQVALFYGYSQGGDTATQTVFDIMNNPNRGICAVRGLGAIEAARTARRGALGAVKAMSASGNDLAQNIMNSDVRALNEAWGIGEAKNAKKAKGMVDRAVGLGLMGYMLKCVGMNVALMKGFGTDKTLSQLAVIANNPAASGEYIPVLTGNYDRSTVMGEGVKAIPNSFNRAQHIEQAGDHSSDDNIRKSAARLLYFVNTVEQL